MKEINIRNMAIEEINKIMEKYKFNRQQKKKLFTRMITDNVLDLVLAGTETVRFINSEEEIKIKFPKIKKTYKKKN